MMPLPWILTGLAVLLAWTPKWARPDIYFAVTVEPDFAFTPPARRILHRYWLEVALHTVIALALGRFVGMQNRLALVPALGWLLLGTSWALARARRSTAGYAAAPRAEREASLLPQPQKLPGGWPVALGPLAFLAAAAVYTWVFWDLLPPKIAVHWGLHGADRWVERTPLKVYGFLALLSWFCAVFLLLAYGLMRWSRTISASGQRALGESRFRRSVLWLLIGVQYLVVVPCVLMAFSGAAGPNWLRNAVVALAVIVSLVVVIRLGQGGSHVAAAAEYRPPVGDNTPDAAWKWGQFYYNPDDPALIVEKRFGLGYTFNFGNRWSWVLIAVLLVPAVAAIAFH